MLVFKSMISEAFDKIMGLQKIPNPIIAVVSEVLAERYTHSQLVVLFMEKGAPGDSPIGNKVDKCSSWLKRCNDELDVDAFAVLGGLLENLMEVDPSENSIFAQDLEKARTRIISVLAKYGTSYETGGRIFHTGNALPTKSLHDLIKNKDVPGITAEISRTLKSVETDPPTALTAACAALEALCKTFIESEGIEMPSDNSIKGLWKIIVNRMGFNPASHADDDIKRILSGINSIVDGIGALRTHAGSAHGHGTRNYKVEPRHARLAVNAAHTIIMFVMETWDKLKKGSEVKTSSLD